MSCKLLSLKTWITLVFICICSLGFSQEKKINNYRKWKTINTKLEAVKADGYLLVRLKNYENGKRYIESNYSKETYNLYCEKIDLYMQTLKKSFGEGFSFSKILVFDSKYSKYVYKKDFEAIIFRNPTDGDTINISKNTPHLFADIVDFKHDPHANPLNLTSQKAIRLLDDNLKESEIFNFRQTFSYHTLDTEENGCSHIFQGSSNLSEKLDIKLETSKLQLERLEVKIKEYQAKDLLEYKEIIEALTTLKEEASTDKKKLKLQKKIDKYDALIKETTLMQKNLFTKANL